MPLLASSLPTEAFGLPLDLGPVPKAILDRLENRLKTRFCPFLMASCPRPYPICSLSVDGGRPVAICPHRLLEGQEIFRRLTSSLPGSVPTILRDVHPLDGLGALGWVLFDADHPDLWIGVNSVTPLPASEAGLAHATHDLFRHGLVRNEGYSLFFDWPAGTRSGGSWIDSLSQWVRVWQRPVYSFMPRPLSERLQTFADLHGGTLSPLSLVPVDLERETSGLRLRVSVPRAPKPAPAERGGVWKAILRRRSEWIQLDIFGKIISVVSSDNLAI